jgi:hypothetical protein
VRNLPGKRFALRAHGCDSGGVRVDYFGEGVAARYDEDDAGMFAPEVITPAVDFLAALATEGAASGSMSTTW